MVYIKIFQRCKGLKGNRIMITFFHDITTHTDIHAAFFHSFSAACQSLYNLLPREMSGSRLESVTGDMCAKTCAIDFTAFGINTIRDSCSVGLAPGLHLWRCPNVKQALGQHPMWAALILWSFIIDTPRVVTPAFQSLWPGGYYSSRAGSPLGRHPPASYVHTSSWRNQPHSHIDGWSQSTV